LISNDLEGHLQPVRSAMLATAGLLVDTWRHNDSRLIYAFYWL